MCSKNSKESTVARTERIKETLVGDEVQQGLEDHCANLLDFSSLCNGKIHGKILSRKGA